MSKVRIIVKRVFQPPIDCPASITWETVVIENERLFALLLPDEKTDEKYFMSSVVGAEPIVPEKG